MSRKLQAEVDKLTKEVNANLEAYDTRWQQLKDFNRSQLGLKERMWEEARREQIRGKKHAVRTATLELLDFKHVCDSKGRIETELETILRRLHRHKQQLTEWSCMPELRQQADELRDLRKQVELRYKRGRVFYCRGESSEGLSSSGNPGGAAEPSDAALDQISWLGKFLEQLRRQIAQFEDEVRELKSPVVKKRQPSRHGSPGRETNARESRRTQLETFIQLHHTHCQRLVNIIEALSSRGYEIPTHQVHDLRDHLHQYIDNNDNLDYVVAEDIYMELELPTAGEAPGDDDSTSSSASLPSSSSDCLSDEAAPASVSIAVAPEEDAPASSSASSPLTAPRRSVVEQPASRDETADTKADTEEHISANQAATHQKSGASGAKRMQEIVCIDSAICDWSFQNASTPDRTLAVRAGEVLYVVKIDKSGWSYAYKSCAAAEGEPAAAEDSFFAQTAVHAALSPQRTHIDATHPQLVSGWFPNHVRKSVHDWTMDQASTTASEASAIVSAAAGCSPTADVNLMERLQILQYDEAQLCSANLSWLLNSLTAHIKPQTLCVIHWNWSQSWELDTGGGVRYLDVVKGDRVWVLRLSPAADWAEVRKLDDWECASVGWVPVANLVSPREIVDNLILLDRITAPVPSPMIAPLRCSEHRHFLVHQLSLLYTRAMRLALFSMLSLVPFAGPERATSGFHTYGCLPAPRTIWLVALDTRPSVL